jgi:hypothetical protein
MISQQDIQIEQPITWVIDRIGDRNINPYSINSVAYSVIMDYLQDTNFNNIIYNDTNNNIIYNDVPPTIPFAPLAQVVVIPDMILTEEEKSCCVCLEDKENTDICRLNCTHTFCCNCVKNVMTRLKTCPLCRAEINNICVQTDENRYLIEIH